MSAPRLLALAKAAFASVPDVLAPAIGCELELAEVEALESGGLPEGDFCVLPLDVTVVESRRLELALAAPTSEIATLGRRMLGDEDPDKERELEATDLEGIGNVLRLLGGALVPGLRHELAPDLSLEPGGWWRTEEPGPGLPEGRFACLRTQLSPTGGSGVSVLLRLPEDVFRVAGGGPTLARISGLADAAKAPIEAVLEAEGIPLASDEDAADASEPDLVFLDADAPSALEACRAARIADRTWNVTIVACTSTPTRDVVLGALEAGATHVLAVPPEERTVRRLLGEKA